VGLPWRELGRGAGGVDCWGLRRLILLQLAGVELPSYGDGYSTTADLQAIRTLVEGGMREHEEIPAGAEAPLDGVLLREGREAVHIGTVVRPGDLIHIERERESVVEPYRRGMLRLRVLGFYRYRGN
jgi:cell wall-associated NlpC family hydrolase